MYKTIIVVDKDAQRLEAGFPNVISFETYLREYPKDNEPRTQIINLCDTEHYLSRGYYCSLLAEARQHRVLPTIKTVNELRDNAWKSEDFALLPSDTRGLDETAGSQTFFAFFGQCSYPPLQKLTSRLFRQYPAPVLRFILTPDAGAWQLKLARHAITALDEAEYSRFVDALKHFLGKVWRSPPRSPNLRWDLAILVNPQESEPPSDQAAIARFIKAATGLGIRAETVTIDELENISNYDALFIRECTAIDHYTYQVARRAEKAGLVVIDDPTSILRCCNKVYLHDAFDYQNVPCLKTEILLDSADETLARVEAEFGYPLVIKMPEGSFSSGVYKVESRRELKSRIDELLARTALVLVQEYLYTEYDWRIGVLNGKPLYSCRYYMARNHWQIYNHESQKDYYGRWETMPTFETPKVVLKAACAAGAVVGDGLYGVDIKQHGKSAFVIEVNDNPSIERGVEDGYLGDELYRQVMAEFLRRLEGRGR